MKKERGGEHDAIRAAVLAEREACAALTRKYRIGTAEQIYAADAIEAAILARSESHG